MFQRKFDLEQHPIVFTVDGQFLERTVPDSHWTRILPKQKQRPLDPYRRKGKTQKDKRLKAIRAAFKNV